MRIIGICLHAIHGLSDEDFIKKAVSLGFGSTFTGARATNSEQAALAALLAKHGMIYENLHAPYRGINDIWLPGEAGDAMLRSMMDCVDRCEAADVHIMVTHLSSGMTPPSITDLGRDRFARLVDYAAAHRVKIAFENQRKLANLAWAMETFPSDVAGFCWDCGHESCFTPGREFMPLFGDRLLCTHIHDNSGEWNADHHLLPFDGAINYDRFAEHIRQSGYQGSLTLEIMAGHHPMYADYSIDQYLEKAAAAIRRLRTMADGE